MDDGSSRLMDSSMAAVAAAVATVDSTVKDFKNLKRMRCSVCQAKKKCKNELKDHYFWIHFRKKVLKKFVGSRAASKKCHICNASISKNNSLAVHLAFKHQKIREFISFEEGFFLFNEEPYVFNEHTIEDKDIVDDEEQEDATAKKSPPLPVFGNIILEDAFENPTLPEFESHCVQENEVETLTDKFVVSVNSLPILNESIIPRVEADITTPMISNVKSLSVNSFSTIPNYDTVETRLKDNKKFHAVTVNRNCDRKNYNLAVETSSETKSKFSLDPLNSSATLGNQSGKHPFIVGVDNQRPTFSRGSTARDSLASVCSPCKVLTNKLTKEDVNASNNFKFHNRTEIICISNQDPGIDNSISPCTVGGAGKTVTRESNSSLVSPCKVIISRELTKESFNDPISVPKSASNTEPEIICITDDDPTVDVPPAPKKLLSSGSNSFAKRSMSLSEKSISSFSASQQGSSCNIDISTVRTDNSYYCSNLSSSVSVGPKRQIVDKFTAGKAAGLKNSSIIMPMVNLDALKNAITSGTTSKSNIKLKKPCSNRFVCRICGSNYFDLETLSQHSKECALGIFDKEY